MLEYVQKYKTTKQPIPASASLEFNAMLYQRMENLKQVVNSDLRLDLRRAQRLLPWCCRKSLVLSISIGLPIPKQLFQTPSQTWSRALAFREVNPTSTVNIVCSPVTCKDCPRDTFLYCRISFCVSGVKHHAVLRVTLKPAFAWTGTCTN